MKTVIEAGHYYAVNGPSVLSMKGWKIGKLLAAGQLDTALALFIDDYHSEQEFLDPNDSFLDPVQGECALQTLASEAKYIFSEAEIAELAPAKIAELLENNLIKLKKGVLSAGGVRLGRLRRR